MANILQIKRSAYNGTTAPSDSAVIAGEMAISQGSKKVYIGRENNSGGTVEAYHLPLLTDLSVTNGISVSDDSTDANTNGRTISVSSTIAGDGLAYSSGVVSVNVDDSSIETDTDTMRVKALGITNAMLAGSIANSKLDSIANSALTNDSITISDGANTSDIDLGTTLTIQGTADEVTVAESAGTVTVGLPNDVIVTGDLTVNGTTTTVNSTVVTYDDPCLTLGGDTAPTATTSSDNGFEFRYYDGSAKVGFVGVDRSADEFVFIPSATNTSEVFSGDIGNARFSTLTGTDNNSGNGTLNSYTIDGGSF